MNKKIYIVLIIIVLIAALVVAVIIFKEEIIRYFFKPTETNLEIGVDKEEEKVAVEVVAQNLNIPWEIAFLPDGGMLVTERPGNLLKIDENKNVITIEGVEHVGEGGLLGLALHPNFSSNNYIYLYLTTRNNGGLINRVERYVFSGNAVSDKKIILNNIPGASNHDGGRIAFGPDGYLYITTGDASNKNSAQSTTSLTGKILRIKDDGTIPDDNPFNNGIYSYGHRNPQGITWDKEDDLWSSEHGSSANDELNLIVKGGNFGWPIIEGDETKEGMIGPVVHSGADETWAPSGAAFYNGSIYFAGLRGESLYQAKISKDNIVLELKAHFRKDYGRIRAVVLGPDDYLYISTSNTDGRGSENEGDDKIIRIDPKSLQ